MIFEYPYIRYMGARESIDPILSILAREHAVIRKKIFENFIKISYIDFILTHRCGIKSTESSKIFILGIWLLGKVFNRVY